jgi:predicted RNase H-like nuclease (RuvC/YqgF family)
MMSNIPNSAVNAVLDGRSPANKAARITELEKELKKVRDSIEEQERLDRRYATVQRAFDKLKRELFKTLTREELDAIDGAYLFLHSGSVDLVRNVPSATSRGEDLALDKDLRTVEALKELESLTK